MKISKHMAIHAMRLVFCILLPVAPAIKSRAASNFSIEDDSPRGTMLTDITTNAVGALELESVFARSLEAHSQSMEMISKFMTLPRALQLIERSSFSKTPVLKQIAGLLSSRQNLRKHLQGQDGFGGLKGAKLLLNDMIHEVMVKYDQEIAKCTSYYAAQCALMVVARGHISAANYIAANSRMLILDSQATINHCEVAIPSTKLQLKDHLSKCKKEIGKMNGRLKIILGDIAVMTMILEMSDCDKKLLQMNKLTMLKCKDECSNKHFVTFNHKELQQRLGQLKSRGAQDLLSSSFADMFDDGVSEGSVELMQVE